MIFKMRMSIATKLILASMLLVGVATLPVSYQSSRYFEMVSKEKEEDANLTYSMSRATETDNILQALLEKSRSLGALVLVGLQSKKESGVKSIELLLENDRDIFAMDIYKLEDGDLRLKKSLIKKKKFEELGTDETLLERIRLKNPFPLESVAQGQIEIVTMTGEKDLPLMGFGLPVSRNNLGQVDAITVTYFQLTRLQRAFSHRSVRTVFLVDARGVVLAHPNETYVLEGKSLAKDPVVAAALNSSMPREQINFQSTETGESHLGAYVKTALGPIVISEISDQVILAPAVQARRQSIFIAGVVLSLVLLVVFLLSMTFSAPIEKLAHFIRQVSAGNLDVTAKDKIKSKDEVGELAIAFDEMVLGLRERAKAYSVMRQALGANVINVLMTMKEEELGGMRKPVSVLFSDLRDFTKFSEGHSPEEVVDMLNEYFDVMVKVISKHNGWLDKFIGDAIMAVWGVPYTGENDAGQAMQAALDMRIELDRLNNRRIERGLHPIKIGIGLHSGDAIVGKIGAAERANLTVIGDTVNQASRIEASTKAFGVDILLSQDFTNQVKDKFVIERAGAAEVKGKAEALVLYKVMGYYDEAGQPIEVKTAYSEYSAEGADKVKIAS